MMTENLPDQAPEACTLPTAQRPLRVAEFDSLFATSTTSVDRLAPDLLHWKLVGEPAVAAHAADLAARESRCCSFFTFTVTLSGGAVGLHAAVDDGHVAVLDALENWSRAAIGRGPS